MKYMLLYTTPHKTKQNKNTENKCWGVTWVGVPAGHICATEWLKFQCRWDNGYCIVIGNQSWLAGKGKGNCQSPSHQSSGHQSFNWKNLTNKLNLQIFWLKHSCCYDLTSTHTITRHLTSHQLIICSGIIILSGHHFDIFVFMLLGCRVGYWPGTTWSTPFAIPTVERGMDSNADVEKALPFIVSSLEPQCGKVIYLKCEESAISHPKHLGVTAILAHRRRHMF